MRAATATAVIEDGEGGGEGRFARSERVVSRMSEGEKTLSAKSVMSTAAFDIASMVVGDMVATSAVSWLPSDLQRKLSKGRKRKRKKGDEGYGRT